MQTVTGESQAFPRDPESAEAAQATDAAHWSWKPFDSDAPDITFTPAQFSPQAFTVFTDLPGNWLDGPHGWNHAESYRRI